MLGLHWRRRPVVGIGAGWGEREREGEGGIGLKRDADWRREG